MIATAPVNVQSPFASPREFLENRFIYTTISPRARGLSVGVNLNPDKQCNFDCVYCEVNRATPGQESVLDVDAMVAELEAMLLRIQAGDLQKEPPYQSLPDHLLQLRHVALSGDGEPTLSPYFLETVHAVLHLRALSKVPFFKVVLITNSSGLDRPEVREALGLFTSRDEVWAKLDAGTDDYLQAVNRTDVPLRQILDNILQVARVRPVIIQSLFSSIRGGEPSPVQLEAYAERLLELVQAEAQIPLVQIYSATRPQWHEECQHLPLRKLSQIAQAVREKTGLKVEVF